MVLLEAMWLLHFLGLVWGVGGATVAAILMAKADRNPEMAPLAMKVMPAISKLIWAAIILLIISGIALAQLVTFPFDATMLLVKHIVVAVLVLNGIILTFGIMPKMQKLAPKDGKPSAEFLKAKKNAKVSSTLGLVLWYVILVLSVMM